MTLLALLTLISGAMSDTAVICPAEFRPALAPWVTLRESEGHAIAFLDPARDATQQRAALRRLANQCPLRYVLLVGDAGGAGPLGVPSRYLPAAVNVRFGSEPEIVTDNYVADLDDDGSPDVALGRLAADTSAELATIVSKIVAYERGKDFGSWRREVHFVAGGGGFGPVIDSAVEMAARSVITSGMPPAYHAVMTQSSWTSPYFPDPRQFHRSALAGLSNGCLFWVYLGHGQRRSLDLAPPPYFHPPAPILDVAAAREMMAAKAPAIACLFACYSGAFDGPDDCLGEELLKAPGGPVAVLCASRVTMPYGMTVLGTELLSQALVKRRASLGDAVLEAKRAALDPANTSSTRKSLDMMATILSPAPVDLATERAEHVAMFNLLGDPLLSLKHPRPITLSAARRAKAGEELEIVGDSPIAGAAVFEVVVSRERLRFEPEPRSGPPTSLAEADRCGETYRAANDPALVREKMSLDAGPFVVPLRLPAEAKGACSCACLSAATTTSRWGPLRSRSRGQQSKRRRPPRFIGRSS